jgi:hypothetical protein
VLPDNEAGNAYILIRYSAFKTDFMYDKIKKFHENCFFWSGTP